MDEPFFNLHPGRILSGKYEIIHLLGEGYEGQVYKIREIETGIDRAAKFFFPKRNPKNKALKFQARKSHKLRHLNIFVHYNTIESFTLRNETVHYLVSELVDGVMLKDFIAEQPKKRLTHFEALHLLYNLASGMTPVHYEGEYHGDLHSENIMLTRYGLRYRFKAFDFFQYGGRKQENIFDDVIALIQIFHESLGGAKSYAKHPPVIKEIICGQKHSLIYKKYRNAGQLRSYLANLNFL